MLPADPAPLIESLRRFRKRKGMFVQPVTVDTVMGYLAGFRAARIAPGVSPGLDGWWAALDARGLLVGSQDPVKLLEARGLGPEAIMDELIAIEIDATLRDSGPAA